MLKLNSRFETELQIKESTISQLELKLKESTEKVEKLNKLVQAKTAASHLSNTNNNGYGSRTKSYDKIPNGLQQTSCDHHASSDDKI